MQGFGGQGVVLAGNCLVHAAIFDGIYGQSLPCYGPERRAGIVTVFLRLSDKPIRKKCAFMEADCAILMLHSLLEAFTRAGYLSADVGGASPEGKYIMRADDAVLRSMFSAGGTGISIIKLRKGGIVVANTKMKPEDFKTEALRNISISKLAVVDADNISDHIYGKRAIPLVNVPMLGAFAKAVDKLSQDSIISAVKKLWPKEADLNVKAFKMAYEATKVKELLRV